ncbi:TolC family outer membrane protein [uncultured Ralstonia sp.]|jgi:outer membrane protein|uniref:TolC family outer membrane protein n=1 Tax=Ralstonia sp. TaxID=54061 RepID=UPI0025F9850F|nr:TolC family outer membrane protein [uncultured Ralstonia sp.]
MAARGSLVVLCCSLVPVFAWAQTPSPGAADLLSAYRAALANDPQFASARAQSLAQGEKLTQGRAGLLPQIGGAWSSTRVIFDQNAPVDFNKTFSSTGWTLSLSQPLFRWDRWETYKQGEIAAAAAEASLAQAQLDLITRTAQAYFDVLNAQDTLQLATAQRDAIQQQYEQARRNFDVGNANITDANDAQARRDAIDATVIAAQSDLEVKQSALKQITGEPIGRLAGVRDGVALPQPEPTVQERWVDQARTGNLQVALAQFNLQSAAHDVNKAKAGHLPSVDLVAQTGHTNASGNQYLPSLPGGARFDSSQIGVQVSIPIFAGGAIQSRVRENIALETKAASDLEFARRGAEQGARQAYIGVIAGLAQVKALEAAEVSARTAYDSNQLAYGVGVRIGTDVLNAQAQLFQARRDLARARYDTIVNGLRLKSAAGALSEADVVQVNTLLTANAADSITALPRPVATTKIPATTQKKR